MSATPAEAARKAQALLDATRPARADHPYVARKQIVPAGLREIDLADVVRIIGYPPKGGKNQEPLEGPTVLVVLVYIDGILSTVEMIDGPGRKSFLAGGRTGGGYWTTDDLPDSDWTDDLEILIGEGMATVLSASMATGHLGVAAMSCGNLAAVGKAIRGRYPKAKIVFVADVGTGEEKSAEAARVVGGLVAVPKFPDGTKGKDVNDLHVGCGLEAVKACIAAAAKPVQGEPVAVLPDGREYANTESGYAARFADLIRTEARFVADLGLWYWHDGSRWVPDVGGVWILGRSIEVSRALAGEAAECRDPRLYELLIDGAQKTQRRQCRENIIALAKAEPGLSIMASQFDADPWLFNVSNGTVNLLTGQLHPHSAADLITKLAPVRFDPEAKSPRFDLFMVEVVTDPETIAFLQKAVGYTLTGDVSEHASFFIHGPTRAGKTVFVELVQSMVGDYSVLAPTSLLMMKQGESHPCDRNVLKGVRVAVFTEMPAGQRWDLPTYKSLTGGDTITSRGMRENFSTFKPTAKLWMVGNHRPIVAEDDPATWERQRVIPIDRTIPEADRDPQLPEKLRAEMSGVLNWALAGCLAWQRERLGQSAKIRAATGAYREESDRLAPFVAERCSTDDSEAVVKRSDLYLAYVAWANAQGERHPMSDRVFRESMLGHEFVECNPRFAGHQRKAWRGIQLLDTADMPQTSLFQVKPYESAPSHLTGKSDVNPVSAVSAPAPTDAPRLEKDVFGRLVPMPPRPENAQ